MAGYSDFSFTSIWARIGGGADKVVAASGNAPRGVVVDLSKVERENLLSRIAPFISDLEQLRLSTLETVDQRARLWVPLAGLGVLLALLFTGQGIFVALIFGILAAFVGWFIAMGNRSSTYQTTVKSCFAPVISEYLGGFDHVVEPETDLAQLRGWCLFPVLQSARTTDRLIGVRDGREVTLSEMLIAYAPRRNKKHNLGDYTLNFTVIQMASDWGNDVSIVLTPKDAPPRLLLAQSKTSELAVTLTGDSAFDEVYSLRISDPGAVDLLPAEMRYAILALIEIAPGSRPYLVLRPGFFAVLFPTQLADLAFYVPPYWISLDADALVAQFASDLALKNALLNGVLALSGGAKVS
ncbi:MAG: hypothetical protein M0Q95_10505 [Porticoccaceae bacterium]|nr:hypothetical protein [Porticoccaceae bacterium]